MAREHTIADLAKPFVDGPQHDGAAGAYALPRVESFGYVFVDARAPALYTGLRLWQWVEFWFNLERNDEWTCSTAAICS